MQEIARESAPLSAHSELPRRPTLAPQMAERAAEAVSSERTWSYIVI